MNERDITSTEQDNTPTDQDTTSRGHDTTWPHLYRWAMLSTAILLCIPIILVQFPPLADYPNHLARAWILHNYDASAFFRSFFVRIIEPTPNIASDVIVVLLMKVFHAEAAGRIFLGILVLAFVYGCHVLGRGIHGRATWLAIPCSFLIYSSTFLYGFVNYVLGVAMFCIAFGLWLTWRTAWSSSRVAAISTLMLASYLSHLTAYAFLGITCVVVTSLDLMRKDTSMRKAVVSLMPLLPPLAAFVVFMGKGGSVGKVEWNSVTGKAIGLMTPISTYTHTGDAALVIALVIIASAAFRMTRVSVWPAAFASGVVLLGLFFAAPLTLLTASAVDVRFVLPASLVMILSARITATYSAGRAILVAATAVMVLRLGDITATWVQLDHRAAAQVAALEQLPLNARVYPVFIDDNSAADAKATRGLTQAAHYATIRRDAFLPSLFAFRGQQPLVYRNPELYVRATTRRADRALPDEAFDYDYLWAYGIGIKARESLVGRCAVVSDRDGFLLCQMTNRK